MEGVRPSTDFEPLTSVCQLCDLQPTQSQTFQNVFPFLP